MTSKQEKQEDLKRALDILERLREDVTADKVALLISMELGKGETDYLRVTLVHPSKDSGLTVSHLTWAMAKAFGYTLKERGGYWYLAIGGGNYSKPHEVTDTLAKYYGLDAMRYERI